MVCVSGLGVTRTARLVRTLHNISAGKQELVDMSDSSWCLQMSHSGREEHSTDQGPDTDRGTARTAA